MTASAGAEAIDGAQCTVIAIGSTELVMAPGEVHAVESALHMDEPADHDTADCGSLDTGSARCPVYALDAALRLLAAPSPTHRLCVVVAHGSAQAAFLADAVRSVPPRALRLVPMPTALLVDNSPVDALAMLGSLVMFASSARSMTRWLALAAGAPSA